MNYEYDVSQNGLWLSQSAQDHRFDSRSGCYKSSSDYELYAVNVECLMREQLFNMRVISPTGESPRSCCLKYHIKNVANKYVHRQTMKSLYLHKVS